MEDVREKEGDELKTLCKFQKALVFLLPSRAHFSRFVGRFNHEDCCMLYVLDDHAG